MTDPDNEAAWLAEWVHECRYIAGKLLPDGRYAAVAPYLYTTAIIVGEIGNRGTYLNRWCYRNLTEAALAFAIWDGEGEPDGWHRHPASGRRVSTSPNDIDDHGNRVGAIGVLYVRR